MRRNPVTLLLLLLTMLLLCSACVPLRTLGPAVSHEARVPDILLQPYDARAMAVDQFITTSDHLRDLQAAGDLEFAQRLPTQLGTQFVSSSDHLRDLQAIGALK